MRELLQTEVILVSGGKRSVGGYLKDLGIGVAGSAATFGLAGAVGGPAAAAGGAFVGAHFGAIGASIKWIIKGD
ncbi:hypothetical protein [Entomobacter blattae]|uniref:Bacteriocin n=1 Tax=Entomobacter blattae TaxID=2762277 RepID=A0A7H1NTR4_9PROT|nr:hypothetical protein [Entomobacter blattae]QNT79174.1 hypothetical protein JGUZn3_19690 [Entomobacter blattae]QNT79459.1 hypothetical protein JGUZn3_22580 [Entomobacter blattae]